MSTSALCQVFRTKATTVREYRNGWGTGPLVWKYIAEVVMGKPGADWSGYGSDHESFWAFARSAAVPRPIAACHTLCCDYALVLRKDCKAMSDLVSEGGRILREWAPQNVNHFEAIAGDLLNVTLDRRARGFGLCCTSVADVWRAWRPGHGEPFDAYHAAMNPEPTP